MYSPEPSFLEQLISGAKKTLERWKTDKNFRDDIIGKFDDIHKERTGLQRSWVDSSRERAMAQNKAVMERQKAAMEANKDKSVIRKNQAQTEGYLKDNMIEANYHNLIIQAQLPGPEGDEARETLRKLQDTYSKYRTVGNISAGGTGGGPLDPLAQFLLQNLTGGGGGLKHDKLPGYPERPR